MISASTLYALAGIALFAIGLVRAAVSRKAIRRIIALNVTGSGVFLVFVALAKRSRGMPDPVPHAMVLTGIVVSVSATAVALFLTRSIPKERR